MSIETLWAPWRLGYVKGQDRGTPAEPVEPQAWRPGAEHACFLCRAAAVDAVVPSLDGGGKPIYGRLNRIASAKADAATVLAAL